MKLFLSFWVYFHERSLHRTNQGRGAGYLFNFSWETNVFGQRTYGEVTLNGRTNDQIMPRWGKSFINDRCIFHKSEHCKSSLED